MLNTQGKVLRLQSIQSNRKPSAVPIRTRWRINTVAGLNYINKVILIAAVARCLSAAPSPPCTATSLGTAVFFVNGVFTADPEDARQSAKLLIGQVNEHAVGQPAEYECLQPKIAFNYSHGLEDLLQATDQIWLGEFSHFWRTIANREDTSSSFISAFDSVAASADAFPSIITEELDQHLQLYRQELAKHNKLVIVGHSQGNLYASAAYMRLTTNVPSIAPNALTLLQSRLLKAL
jgi:hypothetical protein